MKNLKKELKYSKKGITLIALVVTIIVLLILAGVTIATLIGNNGLLTRAQEAKNKTEQAEKDEKTNLAKTEDLINQYVNGIEVEQVTDENPGILEGAGTDDNPYTINSIEDLVVFASNVTNGTTYEEQTVKLGLSLDFNSTKSYADPLRTDYGKYGYAGELKTLLTTGEGFKPIGTTYDANVITNYFEGTFDGDYNAIYNLYQNFEDSNNTSIIGFFSTNAGVIENLIIENTNINSSTDNMHILVGAVCGRNNGTIINCGSSGNLKIIDNGVKSIYCAGITGQAIGSVERSFSKTNIEVISNNASTINVGGITGALTKDYIKSCYNTGTINIDLNSDVNIAVGGISGYNTKTIENSYNSGKIELKVYNELTKNTVMGNILATNDNGIINNCFNVAEIKVESNIDISNNQSNIYISNILGMSNYGNMNNCYNTGILNIENKDFNFIGQIVGDAYKTILNNCFGIMEEDTKAIGNQNKTTINNVTLIEKNEVTDILQIIGEEFKNDSKNINQGYPVLNWE